jgi:hypothetical protein
MKRNQWLALLCSSALCIASLPAARAQTAVCTQANALSVLVSGTTAVAYLPNAAWYTGGTGIRVVPLEGGGSLGSISTPGYVDSCASNPTTLQTVCTATDTDVYLITGSTLTSTLTSAGNGIASFSGGECGNCGVAINTATNIAYIEEGTYVRSSGEEIPALQALDLSNNTFGRALKLNNGLSESILVDPIRNVLLSATEQSSYDIVKLNGTNNPKGEYGNYSVSAEFDSSGEDCSTGLLIGSDEFTGNLFFADLLKAKYNKTALTWTDTKQALINFPDFNDLSAGTTGLSVAPGTHYAVLSGEFGGNVAGALQLPTSASLAKSGLKDYVVATLPTDPEGYTFQNGYDPHSVTTYTSPNNGKAYAVLADWASGEPDYLAVIDIAALLAAPRVHGASGVHVVDPTYDLIANGVLHYVQTY